MKIFGFDLTNQIYSNFQKIYNKGTSNDYLDSAYLSSYPKDPFGETLDNIDNMQMQLKVAGAKYIEEELKKNKCSLSQKEIWGILYYFVSDFRAEIARKVKMKVGNTKSKDYVFDESTIEQYCQKYYDCSHIVSYKENFLGIRKNIISAPKPGDVMTNCKEYFQSAYAKGNDYEKRTQNLNKSQAGADKFGNASTDDSPYDIMSDLNNIGILLYEEVVSPLTPVFYNLPVFSNSAKSLSNAKNGNYVAGDRSGSTGRTSASGRGNSGVNNKTFSSGNSVGSVDIGISNQGSVNLGNKNDSGSQRVDNGSAGVFVTDESKEDNTGTVVSLSSSASNGVIADAYDELWEGLGSRRGVNKGTLFYGSLCEDDEIEVEPEGDDQRSSNGDDPIIANDDGYDPFVLSEEEYQEAVDYMLSAVDQYVVLSEETKQEVSNKVANMTGRPSSIPEEIDNAIDEIKNCRQSCEGLPIDQKASCQIMCNCGEWTSVEWGLFDPEDHPGLGPILMVRYCTVPAVDTRFSIGGKKIVSVEEGSSEILGVVDKLSREGKLGIRTQQNNFLDSSAKKMNFHDAIAFSISVEYVNLGERPSDPSQQYQEMNLQKNNKSWKSEYRISNSLNSKLQKNRYRIVGSTADGESELLNNVSFFVDQIADSYADRYVSMSEDLDNYLDQQGRLWVQIKSYLENIYQDAQALYSKPRK